MAYLFNNISTSLHCHHTQILHDPGYIRCWWPLTISAQGNIFYSKRCRHLDHRLTRSSVSLNRLSLALAPWQKQRYPILFPQHALKIKNYREEKSIGNSLLVFQPFLKTCFERPKILQQSHYHHVKPE